VRKHVRYLFKWQMVAILVAMASATWSAQAVSSDSAATRVSATRLVALVRQVWERDHNVYREDKETNSQKTRHEEPFPDITDRSFLPMISNGAVDENPTSTWVARRTRLQTDPARMVLGALPITVSSHPGIDKLIRSLSGSWSLSLRFAPSGKMPKGGSGSGEETFHAGPGGLSVIEEYHSTGDDASCMVRQFESEWLRLDEGRSEMGRRPTRDSGRIGGGWEEGDL